MAAAAAVQPKSMSRAKHWSEEVEEAYRFQTAGYRDLNEYKHLKGQDVSTGNHLNSLITTWGLESVTRRVYSFHMRVGVL